MTATKEDYAHWCERLRLIRPTSRSDEWISPLCKLLDEILDRSRDTNVTANARDAQRFAARLNNAKRKNTTYGDFLDAHGRLEIAVGMHLLDLPPGRRT